MSSVEDLVDDPSKIPATRLASVRMPTHNEGADGAPSHLSLAFNAMNEIQSQDPRNGHIGQWIVNEL
ncbi:hypothetical protein T265_04481 [Opisthorchis viverrini]|uniref:Uncharacterized protein n=1 Tax=Opisthorchis viverrini TaxID=6198 RepID=A0A074ZN26_OPIVI|nr:hypothetical protein T265_04481 [Opisthorchis viverrini]KER28793.1 hypothetical protein T265_04481 [Opisthorchis viverrini]